jgi:hypothetical protein
MPLEGPDPPRFRRLSQLIGLGPGFTPSGDDFIAGALAGERMSQIFGQPGFAIDKGELRTSLCKTNDAGKTLLWQALQGHFPCYLTEAVKGLSRAGGPHDLARVVSRATVHGETSGTDALAGLLWYLDACSPKMEGLHG